MQHKKLLFTIIAFFVMLSIFTVSASAMEARSLLTEKDQKITISATGTPGDMTARNVYSPSESGPKCPETLVNKQKTARPALRDQDDRLFAMQTVRIQSLRCERPLKH